MRKYVVFIVTIFLLLLFCGCQKEDTVSIGIIPLDSRPCNTQYAQLLGEMAGYEVLLPEPELLDHFTQPSNPEMLWRWLEQQ